MVYEIHLDRPLPEFVLETLEILEAKQNSESEFVYKIDFASEIEHEEFLEIVYSILDYNGSEEVA